jgi:hypothetical protein
LKTGGPGCNGGGWVEEQSIKTLIVKDKAVIEVHGAKPPEDDELFQVKGVFSLNLR